MPWKNIIIKEDHISLLRECDLCGWLPGGFFIFTADTSSLLMNKAEAFALETADRKNSPPFLHKFVRPLPPWKIHNSISSSLDPSSPSLGSRTIEPNPSRLWAKSRQRWIYSTDQVEWVKKGRKEIPYSCLSSPLASKPFDMHHQYLFIAVEKLTLACLWITNQFLASFEKPDEKRRIILTASWLQNHPFHSVFYK